MRLLLITHSYAPERTPPQRRWVSFIKEFRAAGWEVDVLVPHADPRAVPGVSASRRSVPVAPRRGQHGENIRRTWRLPGLSGSRSGRFLGHIVHAIAAVPVGCMLPRPDAIVITVPALPTVVPGRVLAALRRVPLIVEMRDAWPDLARESGVTPGPLSRLMERLVTGAQLSADLVVTVTEGFAERLAARGVGPVEVVGNGVALAEIDPVPARNRPEGELHVLYLGNHGESQGLEDVIRAAALVQDGPERITVRLVGDGTQREALKTFNAELGGPVTMLDPVHGQDLVDQYAWADTCVVPLRADWPSFEWTIPSKTYELLAVGRHITGIVTGEAARVLQESQAADVVAADPEQIARLWRDLARRPESTRVSGRGRRWVAEHADLPQVGQRLVSMVTSLVPARRLPSPIIASDPGTRRCTSTEGLTP